MDVTNVTADADQFTANAYLVEGTTTVLVDAGAMPGVEDVVADHVDALDAVVITHQDRDHVAELDAVVRSFDPAVYAYATHPLRTHSIGDGDDVAIGDGEYEAVYTPGHADDHLAFVGGRALFSGDVVVHDDGAFEGGSFGRTDRPGQSRQRLIESLETLLDRLPGSAEELYAGHGGTFTGDVRSIVETALERAERREPKYPGE